MLTKQIQPKDLDPILLDDADVDSEWIVEEEFPNDLSWLDEEAQDLSSMSSQMETPNTPTSQLLQPSDVATSSSRSYFRRPRA